MPPVHTQMAMMRQEVHGLSGIWVTCSQVLNIANCFQASYREYSKPYWCQLHHLPAHDSRAQAVLMWNRDLATELPCGVTFVVCCLPYQYRP